MASLDDKKVEEIVAKVVAKLAPALEKPRPTPARVEGCAPSPPHVAWQAAQGAPAVHRGGRRGIYDDVDSAVKAARAAHDQLVDKLSLKARDAIVAAMRRCAHEVVNEIAHMAVDETGLGRVDDKINKNLLVADKTPGTEILRPWAQSGDDGLVLMERAPYGVIGAITPTTNPTETILCNGIGMIAAGNAVVFNVHPSAKKVSRFFVEKLNEAMVRAGAPEGLLSMVGEPTIESANALMKHPGVRLVVVTGGPGVVKAAMLSGKRAICGGPGNPPVVVDETADMRRAGKGIVLGCSLDNNIVCIAEKEVFVVDEVADMLKRELCQSGAAEMSRADVTRLEKVVMDPDGEHPHKDWVGKDAAKIARAIGKSVPEGTRVLLCEVDSEEHPFVQAELLMPVLPLVRVKSVDEGIAAAVRVEHGFGHTAAMYSTNIDSLHKMARATDCSIFVKNAPTYAGLGLGGEGYTSFTIASPTGEGLTTAVSFSRERRCTLKDHFRIV
ncbi:MAG: aldehyde dehydrogenase EutE [Deltaproteobacteria bacterium]|nr:aldehyde dehydrogenase EutE [Deltaproteobacteria bacterium]